MVYATYALDTPNTAITRALIMVHGAGRNADHYFETATAAGVSRRRARQHDHHRAAVHRVARQAAAERNHVARTAATVGDRAACRRRIPPSRRSTSSTRSCASSPTRRPFRISRRSSSRDTRPAASSRRATRWRTRFTARSGVDISYVVANPSSYAWPAAVRPLPTGDADPATADKEALGPERREGAHEVHLRPVRRDEGAELQPLAGGSREP